MMRTLIGMLGLLAAAPALADPGDRWDGVMIAQQTGGAIGGGLVLGTAGMFAGAALASAGDDDNAWAALGGGALGAAIGVPIGVTLGVKLVGDHRGGNGTWLATAGGAVGGALLVIATAPSYGEKMPTWAAVSLASITAIAPAILGYHLSTDEINDSNEKRVMVPLVMMPF